MDQIRIGAPAARRGLPFFARASGRAFEAVDGEVPTIRIYDEIGVFGITAEQVRAELDRIDAPRLRVRINSPGGDVFDGIAIYNDLLAHDAEVDIEIVGVAASIASIVAMAGDTIAIAANAFIMIHQASSLVWGNKQELIDLAATLAKIDDAMVRTYAARTGLTADTITAMLEATTWLEGADAIDNGFADTLISTAEGRDGQAAARFDLSVYAGLPQSLTWKNETTAGPRTVRDLERSLRDAGYSRRTAALAASRFMPKADRQRDAARTLEATLAALKAANAHIT